MAAGRATPAAHGPLGALRSPGVGTLVLSTLPVGFCFGAVEISCPRSREEHGAPRVGRRAARLWAGASAVGGLAYGARAWKRPLAAVYLWLAGAAAARLPARAARAVGRRDGAADPARRAADRAARRGAATSSSASVAPGGRGDGGVRLAGDGAASRASRAAPRSAARSSRRAELARLLRRRRARGGASAPRRLRCRGTLARGRRRSSPEWRWLARHAAVPTVTVHAVDGQASPALATGLHPAGPRVVRAGVRRADRRAGAGLAGDRHRRAHADLRADRLGQDARRVPVGARPARRRARAPTARGSSTSRRSRRSPTTWRRTCARRCAASAPT